ncbi:Grh1p [Rhodotorula paludigena]|uniref:Grh1p n=1 Tax=Rhodotorula paludigena TaxID=86838 RepID=UPI00317A95BD
MASPVPRSHSLSPPRDAHRPVVLVSPRESPEPNSQPPRDSDPSRSLLQAIAASDPAEPADLFYDDHGRLRTRSPATDSEDADQPALFLSSIRAGSSSRARRRGGGGAAQADELTGDTGWVMLPAPGYEADAAGHDDARTDADPEPELSPEEIRAASLLGRGERRLFPPRGPYDWAAQGQRGEGELEDAFDAAADELARMNGGNSVSIWRNEPLSVPRTTSIPRGGRTLLSSSSSAAHRPLTTFSPANPPTSSSTSNTLTALDSLRTRRRDRASQVYDSLLAGEANLSPSSSSSSFVETDAALPFVPAPTAAAAAAAPPPRRSPSSHPQSRRTREETNALMGATLRSKRRVELLYCGASPTTAAGEVGGAALPRGFEWSVGSGSSASATATGKGGNLLGYRLLRPCVWCSITRPSYTTYASAVSSSTSSHAGPQPLVLSAGGVTGGGIVDGLVFTYRLDAVTSLARLVGRAPALELADELARRAAAGFALAGGEGEEEEGVEEREEREREEGRRTGVAPRVARRLREKEPVEGERMLWKSVPSAQRDFLDGLVGEPSDWISPSIETWWLDNAIAKHTRKRPSSGSWADGTRRSSAAAPGFDNDSLSTATLSFAHLANGPAPPTPPSGSRTSSLSRSHAIRVRVPLAGTSAASPFARSSEPAVVDYDRYREDAAEFRRRVRRRVEGEAAAGEGVQGSLERVGYGSGFGLDDERLDLGQAESQPQSGHSGAASPSSSSGSVAFHVLRVAENSPAAEAGIEPFFDFVVGAGGRQLGDEIDLLTDVLEENEGSEVSLQVYSTKRKEVREVYVIPSRTWSSAAVPGGAPGSVDGQPSLLGLSLRLCSPQHALDQVWHVLEILEGSPAQSAGLVPFGDWIVGYAGGVLRGEGDFYDVVEAHVDKPLRLFVYNADYDVTREAILVPNRSWGGEGLLGCGVGYGLLHRIPKPQERAAAARANAAQPYDMPYAAPPQHQQQQPRYQQPPPPSSQQQPPRTSTDRLNSFSSRSNVPHPQNPLYAPPPPRANSAAQPPVRANAAPPPPPAAAGPPRRTAALASYDEHDDEAVGENGDASNYSLQQHDDGSYADDSVQYPAHPSFSHYGGAGADGDAGGYGEYDATEGVSVIPMSFEEGDEEGEDEQDLHGDFARPGAQGRGYGQYRTGSYGGGVAQVVAEEAD